MVCSKERTRSVFAAAENAPVTVPFKDGLSKSFRNLPLRDVEGWFGSFQNILILV